MKNDKIKIAIGAPTYNSVERLQNLLTSIEFYTQYDENSYKIVVLDDGTPDLNKRRELAEMALRFGVDFIQHEKNKGIPAAWNSLTRHFSSDYVVLFNDDIQVCDPNWLKCAIYALENNDKIACVGFPLIHMDPITKMRNFSIDLPSLEGPPGRVGAAVGCAFTFKRKIFDEIGDFDECIKSFYEEIDWGFRLAKARYYSIMLPFPSVNHFGSQTFAQNFELSIQKPDETILPMKKYKEIMLKKYPMERIEPIPGFVYRMDYSRVYFGLKFECLDLLEAPQIETHNKYVNVLPSIKILYLDKNLRECEHEI
jgi:GT2 family glycosyltransferase